MTRFQQINLGSDKYASINSKVIAVCPSKLYSINTEYIGKNGKPFCAYFGIIFTGKNGKEIDRKIRWLNDFSNEKKEIGIVFKAITDQVILIYRINKETPLTSECEYSLLPIEKIILTKCNSAVENISQIHSKLRGVKKIFKESYDNILDYHRKREKELTKERESKLEENIVWLFGSPRSGTTWLANQLKSGKVLTMDEPRIGRFIFPTALELKDDRKDYFFCNEYKKTWSYFLRKLILNRIYSQFHDISNKIIIKDPNASFGASVLSECLPNSKILILIRDGRDVLDSLVDARSENGWVTKLDDAPPLSTSQRLRFIRNQGGNWKKTTEIMIEAFNSKPNELRYMVKYEDLRNNTKQELTEIFKFVGIKMSDSQIAEIVEKHSFENIAKEKKGKGKFARKASPGEWKKNFSIEEQDLIEKLMKKLLKELKYA